MRALSWICIVVLAGLLTGCVYIGSASEPGPDGDAPVRAEGQRDAVAMALPEPAPRPRQLRVLGLDDAATLPGRLGEPPMGVPTFDLAVVDYELAASYPNPLGGIERPPQGAAVLFVLVRATNVTPLRGRPPLVTVLHGEMSLRGCLIAPGDRTAYDVVGEVLPDETVEGWLCRVVPSMARVHEISVAADRRFGVRWRLDSSATIGR
jgi:hypothetical protein